MSSSCRVERREKSGWRERGIEGGWGKRYENMTCLRIGSAKTIHSSGSPSLPCYLQHLLPLHLTIAADHVKGSMSFLRLTACLILREQFTSRAERQWPACRPPLLSIPSPDPVRRGNAPQPTSTFEVLLDALEATDVPLTHDRREKTEDGCRTKESGS